MNPPLPRPEPAKLYRGTRSGSLQDLILRGCSPGLSSPFQARPDLLPSHIPSETVLVGRTPGLPRGPLFIFRKIHLYGKSVKSTHGHTKKKPTQPFFRDLAVFQLPRLPYTERTYPTAKGPTLHRRNGPALRPKNGPTPKGRDLPKERTYPTLDGPTLHPRDGPYPTPEGRTLPKGRTFPKDGPSQRTDLPYANGPTLH